MGPPCGGLYAHPRTTARGVAGSASISLVTGNLPEPRRSRSTLSKLDDVLLVVVVGVVALAVLGFVSWVVGTILFLVRVAVVLAVGAVVVGWVLRRR
jgi:fatty acid desaturase